MRLGEDDWEEIDDNSWRLRIDHLYEVDRFQLLGPGDVKVHLNLESLYQRKPGVPVHITPQSTDPLSPFNWAGMLWEGSVSSSFSASYDDGSWSVKGTAQWAPSLPVEGMTVGHIIHERNGVFARSRDDGRTSE